MSHMKLNRNDQAISPVIGTILMVAATVIIAGAVYAAVNAYGGKSSKPPVDASWKGQALDSDGDGLDDTIKITYLAGPDGASPSFNVSQANGAPLVAGPAPGSWSAGAYQTYHLASAPASPVTVYVTVAQAGSTVLDQNLILRD